MDYLEWISKNFTPDAFKKKPPIAKETRGPHSLYHFPDAVSAPAAEAAPTGNPINEFVNKLFNVRDRDRLREQGLE
jgi:hypothetical protein